ncbi:MAG: type transport system permease protein [Micromonosporaceae bacterium]|nr:type transport system permease protein [Micromonosporaceae bacterium]
MTTTALPKTTAPPSATAPQQRVTTFSVLTELRRQASRPRTRIALACMVALPLVVLIAFEFGRTSSDNGNNGNGVFSSLVTVATSGGVNFALFTLLVSSSFLLVVVFALFFGDTIASEASWGSLRYLLAIPVPRARLLGVKLIVSLIYSVLALVLLVGTALVAGTIRYGWNPLRSTIADQLSASDALVRVTGAAGYIGLTLLVVAALAFLLSVTTDAPLGAVGGAVMLQILSSILNQIDALGSIRNFLPTHYNNAWIGLLSTPVQWDSMVRGTISALAYAVIFFGLSFFRFLRKDIVS